MSDEEELQGEVKVGHLVGAIQAYDNDADTYLVRFDDKTEAWYHAADVTPVPDVLAVIASGITIAEREFSHNVGTGSVPPGEYLTNRDKATEIMAALSRAGYKVMKIDE